MSRLQTTFGKSYPSSQTVNKDGYPAFNLPLKERYIQLLMVNTMGNTYYANASELVEGSLKLHEEMLKDDPVFMAKAIVYARNNGYMRLQPIVGLAFLSRLNSHIKWKQLQLFAKVFPAVIRTPNDLTDLVTMLGNIRTGKGLSRSIKRTINEWFNNLSEYQALKYGGVKGPQLVCSKCGKEYNTSYKGGHCKEYFCRGVLQIKTFWSLRDVLRSTRPVPNSNRESNLFNYICRKMDQDTDLSELPQIAYYEELKRRCSNEQYVEEQEKYVMSLIEKGRLPYEVVVGAIKPTRNIWEYLMKQMPIFALLRNLNTLQRHEVLNKKENIDYVVSKLTNVENVRKSMILPNRIATAFNNFSGIPRIKDALRDMADIALGNIPEIPGVSKIFLDISGSMNGEFKSHGAMLGLGALKASPQAEFWCFGSYLEYPDISVRDSILTNMDKVVQMSGGGTNTVSCIEHLLGECRSYRKSVKPALKTTKPVKADNIIILTDEQQNTGAPVVKAFRKYRRNVNPEAKLFIIDVAPYNTHVSPGHEPGVSFIFGWSDEILRYIATTVQGFEGQKAAIEAIQI